MELFQLTRIRELAYLGVIVAIIPDATKLVDVVDTVALWAEVCITCNTLPAGI
jgi:hypothetical protein